MSINYPNHTRITQGFQSLQQALAPYICVELKNAFGADWWQQAVMNRLYDEQKRSLPEQGDDAAVMKSLDVQRCLLLLDLHWNEVFRRRLSIDHRTWAKELTGVRNRWAHAGEEDFSDNDTWRALDTMSRLCEQLNADSTEAIRALLREARYGSADGSTTVTSGNAAPAAGGKAAGILQAMPGSLPSWRDVIEPHPDVAQGRYRNAEFAADLAQVARGEGAYEYRDPVEFFSRTYVTEGLSGLLEQALRRVGGKDGEPVIQLKTSFGGGKTHSLLALYHLLRGQAPLPKIAHLKPVLERAGLSEPPVVRVAVLVGTALDPSKAKRPQNLPGVTINTLWGEMAAQLAVAANNPKLYDFVKEADKKGVSPGSESLKNLFNACGPCCILMDELVAYAKRIFGVSGLPAGSFDNFISFIQEITEAARASENSLVVASIPESDIEIGGEAGQTALDTIAHTFGRMEAIWKPVSASEGFEVVRRRLFLDCKDEAARDRVCQAFSRMYAANTGDFPLEARELEYRNRLVSCYPIHPEIFDQLYENWATLERFQRTRGVLRLMAAVIHELWMGNDASLMIMPGSLPLDVPSVRDELTRHLPESWNGIVDSEVDGKRSVPYQKDQQNPHYGRKLAARRVARTILLGSAPGSIAVSGNAGGSSTVRGIEVSRIRLGVVQPGEEIPYFNDALNSLQSSLSYLYASGNRYWYDTRPTLRKIMEDRASQVSAPDVEHEIEIRLRRIRKEKPFAGVHACPGSSNDVPDEKELRLVILRTTDTYKASDMKNNALTAVREILENHGKSPRVFKNMIVFLAAESDGMLSLQQEVRRYIAWRSILDDSENLNLDAGQNRETRENLKRSDETVNLRLNAAYCWLFVPYIDIQNDIREIVWTPNRVSIENGLSGILRKMISEESLITKWGPQLLVLELDKLLWKDKDAIKISELWTNLCTYCYLPRLADLSVLKSTICEGVKDSRYALASGMSDYGRFLDLQMGKDVFEISESFWLVKVEVAANQMVLEEPTGSYGLEPTPEPGSGPTSGPEPGPTPPTKTSSCRHFYMTAKLDNTRINRDVQTLVEEIISHIQNSSGTSVTISLEVDASSDEGFTRETMQTVTENARTLKVKDYGFDEEA